MAVVHTMILILCAAVAAAPDVLADGLAAAHPVSVARGIQLAGLWPRLLLVLLFALRQRLRHDQRLVERDGVNGPHITADSIVPI